MFKFAVGLVGAESWGTPWHGCALLTRSTGQWRIVSRKVARENGYELVTDPESGLPHFATP